MAKQQSSSVLNRLAGKKLVFSGKFGYRIDESLKAMAVAQQGAVRDELDAKVDYLVLADLDAGKTIQKQAASLNTKASWHNSTMRRNAGFTMRNCPRLSSTAISRKRTSRRRPSQAPRSETIRTGTGGKSRNYPTSFFAKAKMKSAEFRELQFQRPNFSGADLTGAVFEQTDIESGVFTDQPD